MPIIKCYLAVPVGYASLNGLISIQGELLAPSKMTTTWNLPPTVKSSSILPTIQVACSRYRTCILTNAWTADRNRIRKFLFVKGTRCCIFLWSLYIMEWFGGTSSQLFCSEEYVSDGRHRMVTFEGPFKPLHCSRLCVVCISAANGCHLNKKSQSVHCISISIIRGLQNRAQRKQRQARSHL